jgi:hypothetical protein
MIRNFWKLLWAYGGETVCICIVSLETVCLGVVVDSHGCALMTPTDSKGSLFCPEGQMSRSLHVDMAK